MGCGYARASVGVWAGSFDETRWGESKRGLLEGRWGMGRHAVWDM